MSVPRDHNTATTVGRVRAARLFSNVVSPPVIFALLGLALALAELPLWPALFWAAIYGFWVSLAPILYVVYLLETGRISDLHMSAAGERRSPYVVSVVGSIIALILIVAFGGPAILTCLAIFSIIMLATLALITYFWLISIHAASIAASALIMGLIYGAWAALLLLPLVIVVSWVRIYLRRHTPAQVAAGLALGVSVVAIMTFFGCF
jgi:membrane-associated phospholipid phosphatase